MKISVYHFPKGCADFQLTAQTVCFLSSQEKNNLQNIYIADYQSLKVSTQTFNYPFLRLYFILFIFRLCINFLNNTGSFRNKSIFG